MRISIPARVALALALAAPAAAQAPARQMGAPYHDPSRAFIDFMIPHHESAVMMAEHAAGMVRTEAVRAMARTMAEHQRREVAELKAARKALFGSDSARTPAMGAMMQMMMGMRHQPDSAAAGAKPDSMRDSARAAAPGAMGARGAPMTMMAGDHDRMFLQHMIAHHQDGIDAAIMAEDGQGVARVKALARTIRTGQERELAELRRLLSSLPPAPAAGHKH